MPTLTIALTWPATEEDLRRFRSYMSADCEIRSPKSSRLGDLIDIGRDAEVIVGKRVPQGMIDCAQRVKLVQLLHTGMVDVEPGCADKGFVLEHLKTRGILLGNVSDSRGRKVYSSSVAEEGFALMLALAKRLIPAHSAYIRGESYPFNSETWSVCLVGKTLGIVGLGRHGREVAKRARAFDMRVIGLRRTSTNASMDESGVACVLSPANLRDLLGESDVVMLTAPLTHETFEFIGEAELRTMKRTAFLVNIARAFLVQETALYRALTEGWIAGYGSDVWWNYPGHRPVPSITGVHTLPNVVASNDRATYTPESREEFFRCAFENVDEFITTGRPRYVVDIDKLY